MDFESGAGGGGQGAGENKGENTAAGGAVTMRLLLASLALVLIVLGVLSMWIVPGVMPASANLSTPYLATSPSIKPLVWVVAVTSGIGSLAAGLGVLLRKQWARRLAVWLGMLGLVWSIVSVIAVAREISVLSEGMDRPRGRELELEIVSSLKVTKLPAAMCIAIWNALLLLAFTRPSVKAQFQRSG